MNIGERIKACRKEKKQSQQQIADVIGVQRSAISKYEKGIVDIPFSQLGKIASALGVSVDYLLGSTKPQGKRILTDNPDDRYPYLLNKKLDGTIMPEESEELAELERLNKIAEHLDKLNETGQEEAVKRVSELTEIPRFQKPEQSE